MRALIDFVAIQAAPLAGGGESPGSETPVSSAALQVGFGEPREVLVAHQLDQVRTVLRAVHQRSLQGQWCVGYVRYEAAPAWDRALTVRPSSGPLVWFGIHDAPLPSIDDPGDLASGHYSDNTPHLNKSLAPRVVWRSGLHRPAFDAALERLQQAIASGEIYQANFTARCFGQLKAPPLELFAALRQAQPGGFAAYLDTGDEQVLSVSPELFFDWHQGHIVSRPMKGTAPRGRNAQEDAALAHALRTSPKERAENVMIVDLIRNDLSKLAKPLSVTVDGLCRVLALPTVWQMVTDVHADTRPGTTLDDVFAALFPCGSITGAPKVQAMQLIRELEQTERGIYCGAVGVVRPSGNATFNVPIRTVVVRGTTVSAGTGSGITSDSTATAEWQEWRHKQAYLNRASQDFNLLETLAMSDGVLPHEDAHLARMAASATHFGFTWQLQVAQVALADLRRQYAFGNWRVRVLLDRDGRIHAEAHALPATPGLVRLQLAATPLHQTQGEFVRHKTTRRAHYDAFTPTDTGVFDTVMWNREGEVTECTRGNVAFLLDGQWVTPALTCGLLPGVGRARWLARGRMVEAVVHVGDLPRVQALAFVNSLRGWVNAVWHTSLADRPPLPNESDIHFSLIPN